MSRSIFEPIDRSIDGWIARIVWRLAFRPVCLISGGYCGGGGVVFVLAVASGRYQDGGADQQRHQEAAHQAALEGRRLERRQATEPHVDLDASL